MRFYTRLYGICQNTEFSPHPHLVLGIDELLENVLLLDPRGASGADHLGKDISELFAGPVDRFVFCLRVRRSENPACGNPNVMESNGIDLSIFTCLACGGQRWGGMERLW